HTCGGLCAAVIPALRGGYRECNTKSSRSRPGLTGCEVAHLDDFVTVCQARGIRSSTRLRLHMWIRPGSSCSMVQPNTLICYSNFATQGFGTGTGSGPPSRSAQSLLRIRNDQSHDCCSWRHGYSCRPKHANAACTASALCAVPCSRRLRG